MAFILSRPKRASGTRFTNEITTISDKSDVTRVHNPTVNSARISIMRAYAGQIQRGGTSHQTE